MAYYFLQLRWPIASINHNIASLPYSKSRLTRLRLGFSKSLQNAFVPVAFISVAFGTSEDTISLLLSTFEKTNVLLTVCPKKDTETVDLTNSETVYYLSFVYSPIRQLITCPSLVRAHPWWRAHPWPAITIKAWAR